MAVLLDALLGALLMTASRPILAAAARAAAARAAALAAAHRLHSPPPPRCAPALPAFSSRTWSYCDQVRVGVFVLLFFFTALTVPPHSLKKVIDLFSSAK